MKLEGLLLRMRFFPVITALFILMSCGGGSDSVPGVDSETAGQLQQLLDDAVSAYNIPGVVMAVGKKGRETWVGAGGVSDLTDNKKMTAGHRLRIGSVSKTFTAMVVLQLAQEGRLGLDDTLSKWLPDVSSTLSKYDTGKITIRRMLNHTSGLYNYVKDEDFQTEYITYPLKQWTHDELLKVANDHGPEFSPGEGWYYSNTGYILLGMIIEKVTGNTYEDEVRTRFIEPLGLENTFVPKTGEVSIPGNYSRGYVNWNNYVYGNKDSKSDLTEFTEQDTSSSWTAGNIISTSGDLARWVKAIVTGELLNEQYQKEHLTYIDIGHNFYYGLGIMKEADYGIIGHRGQIYGFDCSIQYVTDKDTAVTVCANRTLADGMNSNEVVLYDALSILFPEAAKKYVSAGKKQAAMPARSRAVLTEY